MDKLDKKTIAQRFMAILEHTAQLTRSRVDSKGLTSGQAMLSGWQCNRLRHTYDDFYQKKRYRRALDFFLTEIYGPVDFSQRDADIARVYPIMVRVLSADAIASLSQGLQLHSLTMELDIELLNVLIDELKLDPEGAASQLTFDLYAEAYRRCDNYAKRREQIDCIVDVGRNLESLTRSRLILMAVKVARKPAQMAGFGELQSFIETGLAGFRAMGSATTFLETLQSRELKLLDAIYNKQPIPADVRVA